MYVATIQCLQRTRIQNMQIAIDISDTPVTLKQSQGHQTCNEYVDLEHDYEYANFERSRFYSVQEKDNVFWVFFLVFQPRKYVNYLP